MMIDMCAVRGAALCCCCWYISTCCYLQRTNTLCTALAAFSAAALCCCQQQLLSLSGGKCTSTKIPKYHEDESKDNGSGICVDTVDDLGRYDSCRNS